MDIICMIMTNNQYIMVLKQLSFSYYFYDIILPRYKLYPIDSDHVLFLNDSHSFRHRKLISEWNATNRQICIAKLTWNCWLCDSRGTAKRFKIDVLFYDEIALHNRHNDGTYLALTNSDYTIIWLYVGKLFSAGSTKLVICHWHTETNITNIYWHFLGKTRIRVIRGVTTASHCTSDCSALYSFDFHSRLHWIGWWHGALRHAIKYTTVIKALYYLTKDSNLLKLVENWCNYMAYFKRRVVAAVDVCRL